MGKENTIESVKAQRKRLPTFSLSKCEKLTWRMPLAWTSARAWI